MDGADPEEALDLAFLARQTFGDEALAQELLALFLRQLETLPGVITGEGARDARRDAAHTLKGAAAAVGARRVAAAASAAEAVIADGRDASREIAAVQEEARNAALAVRRRLEANRSGQAATP